MNTLLHKRHLPPVRLMVATMVLAVASWMRGDLRRGRTWLLSTALLGGIFIAYAIRIYVAYSDALARRTFRYSILYLALLFAALLVDHYLVA